MKTCIRSAAALLPPFALSAIIAIGGVGRLRAQSICVVPPFAVMPLADVTVTMNPGGWVQSRQNYEVYWPSELHAFRNAELRGVIHPSGQGRSVAVEIYTGSLHGTVAADLRSSLWLLEKSSWHLTGSSTIGRLALYGDSFVALHDGYPEQYHTLTITSWFDGGGVIEMNVNVGPGEAAGDQLVFDGAGIRPGRTTLLRVINTGGSGVTDEAGIKVVDSRSGVDAQPDAFAIDRSKPGLYEYWLTTDGGDWWLHSVEANDVLVAPVLSSLAHHYMHALAVGIDPPVATDCIAHAGSGFAVDRSGWIRLIGETGSRTPSRGSAYEYSLGGVQVGTDLWCTNRPGGFADRLGVYAVAGRVQADVHGRDGYDAGTVNSDAYTAGIRWTHRSGNRGYVDVLAHTTRYHFAATPRNRPELATDGWGIAGSVEGGISRLLVGDHRLDLSAQITAQRVALDAAGTDAVRASFAGSESFAGRVGARIVHPARFGKLSVGLHVWNEFAGDSRTTMTSANEQAVFHSDLGGAWAQLEVACSFPIRDTFTLGANVSGDRGLSGDHWAITGRLHGRYSW